MSVRKRYVRPETVESRMSVAVTKQNARNTEALLAEGADPNLRYDRSPLLFSATLPNLRALHAHGANLDIQNENGYTLLNYLCYHHQPQPAGLNHTERIRFLLENGAESSIQEPDDGDAPLHSICRGSIDPVIIRLLLQHGADANQRNNNEETPLHCIAGNTHIFVQHPNLPYQAGIDALLEGGAIPQIRNEAGQLPSEYGQSVFADPAQGFIQPIEREMIEYLEHVERGIPPPPPAPAAPARAANAPPPLNVQNLFNNMPQNHPPPPPPPNANRNRGPPRRFVIRNRPNLPNVAIPIQNNGAYGNNERRELTEENVNRFGGGRRRRRGRTAKQGKRKSSSRRRGKSSSRRRGKGHGRTRRRRHHS